LREKKAKASFFQNNCKLFSARQTKHHFVQLTFKIFVRVRVVDRFGATHPKVFVATSVQLTAAKQNIISVFEKLNVKIFGSVNCASPMLEFCFAARILGPKSLAHPWFRAK
jgi:alpha-glucuronidase